MLQPFPKADEFAADEEAEAAIEWLKGVVLGVRNIRGEADIKPRQTIDVLLQGGADRDRQLAATTEELVKRLAGIETMSWLEEGASAPANALALVGDLKVMVPLAGLIDLAAERARLEKEAARKEQEIVRLAGKLGNASFVAKAPEDVVARERQKQRDAEVALATLREQLASIPPA